MSSNRVPRDREMNELHEFHVLDATELSESAINGLYEHLNLLTELYELCEVDLSELNASQLSALQERVDWLTGKIQEGEELGAPTECQENSGNTQPLAPPEPTSSSASMIFEGPTETQAGAGTFFDEYIPELDQHVPTFVEDPFFQHFQQLENQQVPCVSASSRFFPATSIDEVLATASGVQSPVEHSDQSGEPSNIVLSTAEHDDMDHQKRKVDASDATSGQSPTASALFPQHLRGGIFDSLRSPGRPAS